MRRSLVLSLPIFAAGFCFGAYFPLTESPDAVIIEGRDYTNRIASSDREWKIDGQSLRLSHKQDGTVAVLLDSPYRPVETVRIFWRASISPEALVLTDDWSGLGWAKLDAQRDSAWYFLLNESGSTHGYGVKTQPNAMAYWRVRPSEVELSLDVSAGGEGVKLGTRTLEVCRLLSRAGRSGESAFAAGRAFCRALCPNPRLPAEPVFGYNDWYCAYGANTATNFLEDAAYIVEMAKGLSVRPYVVMDDGWQPMSPPEVQRRTGKFDSGWGPWERESDGFGMAMCDFASRIAALGAKPGLWYRPLRAWDGADAELKVHGHPECFDPTIDANLKRILEEMRRFRAWGFKLVKADFLAYDVIGQFLFPGKVGAHVMADRRCWRDASRTTAERLKDVYRTMREGAGDDMVIIGCGAFGHLAAGFFEINRVGFDTSGKEWERTARNGPHALAMRSIQHGTFYCVDADCVGLASAGAIEWEKNRQWMDLLARSKTAFFVSWRRSLASPEVRRAMAEAFRVAAWPGDVAEPLDWQEERSPRHWRFSDGSMACYDWFSPVSR